MEAPVLTINLTINYIRRIVMNLNDIADDIPWVKSMIENIKRGIRECEDPTSAFTEEEVKIHVKTLRESLPVYEKKLKLLEQSPQLFDFK